MWWHTLVAHQHQRTRCVRLCTRAAPAPEREGKRASATKPISIPFNLYKYFVYVREWNMMMDQHHMTANGIATKHSNHAFNSICVNKIHTQRTHIDRSVYVCVCVVYVMLSGLAHDGRKRTTPRNHTANISYTIKYTQNP